MKKMLLNTVKRRRGNGTYPAMKRVICITLTLVFCVLSVMLFSALRVSAEDGVSHFIDSDLSIRNGKVNHPNRALSGETVTVTAEPDSMRMTASLTALMSDETNLREYTKEVPGVVHPDPNTIVFTMPDADVKITASFGDYTYQRVFIRDMEGGTVISDKNLVKNRETVTLTVKPDNGYVYVLGSLMIVDVEPDTGDEREYPDYSIETLKENEQFSFSVFSYGYVCVSAEFSKLSDQSLYRVETDKNTKYGTLSVDYGWASAGWVVTVTAEPEVWRGYALKSLSVTDRNGTSIETSPVEKDKYTFIMPDSDVSVAAEFDIPSYKITVDSGDAGVSPGRSTGCRVDVTDEEDYGNAVYPALLLTEGTKIAELTVKGDLTGKTVSCALYEHKSGSHTYIYSFIMPDEPVTITARFTFSGHTLDAGEAFKGTVTAKAGGTEMKNLPCTIAAGEEVTLTYRPPEHYKSNGIRIRYTRENGSPLTIRIPVFPKTDGSYTAVFTMPDSDATLASELVAEISTWSGLQAALDAAEKGETVTLYGDIRANTNDPSLIIRAKKDVTLDLNGYTLDRNMTKTKADGYVIFIEDGAALTVMDSSGENSGKITGGGSVNGGGIYCSGTLIFQGGNVTGNKATEKGGGIFIGGTATITGGVISGNRSERDGGGLYMQNNQKVCSVTVSGGVIENNTAAENGGGIFSGNNIWLYTTGGTVRNNSAKYGGGVCIPSSYAEIENIEIKGNKADIMCGGLYVISHSYCLATSCRINENESAQKAGGIAASSDGKIILTDCTVSKNKASVDGGGIYIADGAGLTEAVGCSITENEAGYGGAVYVISGQTITVRDSKIEKNKSKTNGGVVWMGDNANTKADLMNCDITQNEAAQNGGVVYARGKGTLIFTNCVIKQNSAKRGTGGVLFPNGKGLTLGLVNTTVKENSAVNCGGLYTKGSIISLKGLVDIRDNNSNGEGKNLVLAEGSYAANPGLYAGSYVSVYLTGDLVAREISEYQMRYFRIENQKNGAPVGKIFGVEKWVDTPLFASVFGNKNIVMLIVLTSAAIAGAIITVIVVKKKRRQSENK